MERLMFGWDFEVDAWSRFWRWNMTRICVWNCDMNSTLGSVVPLAMFVLWQCVSITALLCPLIRRNGKTRSCQFAKSPNMFTPSTGYIKIYIVVFCFMWQHARWKFGGKRRQFYVFYTAENVYPLKMGCTLALRPRFCGKGAKLTDWHRKTFP